MLIHAPCLSIKLGSKSSKTQDPNDIWRDMPSGTRQLKKFQVLKITGLSEWQ